MTKYQRQNDNDWRKQAKKSGSTKSNVETCPYTAQNERISSRPNELDLKSDDISRVLQSQGFALFAATRSLANTTWIMYRYPKPERVLPANCTSSVQPTKHNALFNRL